MADVTKLKVAAGSLITFNGTDIGHTVDGTTLEIEREFTSVNADIYGTTPIDMVLTGQRATVQLKLAEIKPGTMNTVMPENDYDIGVAFADHSHFGTKAGYSLRTDAAELVITPQGGNSDSSLNITLFKAVNVGNVSLAYKIDEQSVFDGVEFLALVDESRADTDGRLLGRMGIADIS